MEGGESAAGDPSKRQSLIPLLVVLAVALGLRLWGIGWGLSSSRHYFSYHPDENAVLFYAMSGINIFSEKLLPGFYNYGSLQLYLINFANSIVYLLGGVAKLVPTAIDFPHEYDSWGRMLLIGRLIAASMGVWTVGLTYAVGRRLWNEDHGDGVPVVPRCSHPPRQTKFHASLQHVPHRTSGRISASCDK